MKRISLLSLFCCAAIAQVQNIPNTTFPTVRSLLNSNFSYLDSQLSAKQATISGAPASWPTSFTPAAHANTHASSGSDPLSGTLGVSISGNAATATALAGSVDAHQIYAGPASGSAGSPAFRSMAAADIPPVSFLVISADRSSLSSLSVTANGTRVYSFWVPYPILVSGMLVSVGTADTAASTFTCRDIDTGASTANVNCYDLGIYDVNGDFLTDTGALYLSTTGFKSVSLASAVTLLPGWYFWAITGTNNGALLTRSSSGSVYMSLYGGDTNVVQATSNGVLANHISPPAPGWRQSNIPYLALW